jgi:hypothetical protein
MRTVLAGPYQAALAQYRNIKPAVIRDSQAATTPDPPGGFTKEDIKAFLNTQFDVGAIPVPASNNQALYVAAIPPSVRCSQDKASGQQSSYEHHGRWIHYGWIADCLSLDRVTRVMSYELLESVIDPDGDAGVGIPGTCTQHGSCEVADTWDPAGVLDGFQVAPYWTNVAKACVTPAPSILGPAEQRQPDIVPMRPARHGTPEHDHDQVPTLRSGDTR